jgi:mRNA interferase RelE/StbE
MLKVLYQKRFLKDLANIPSKQRKEIEDFVFKTIPQASGIGELNKFEKMTGYKNYYKARFGNYRLGIHSENEIVELKRLLHRKEIYRYFP